MKDNCWRFEEPFEIIGDIFGMGGPRKGRLRVKNKERPLFSGYKMFLLGDYEAPNPSKADLKKIIQYGGGEVLNRLPKKSSKKNDSVGEKIVILSQVEYLRDDKEAPKVKQEYGYTPINYTWLLDSVSNHDLLNLSEYEISQ